MKKLLQQKRALEAQARAKLAEIVDGIGAEAARAIETEHKALLDQIATLDEQIRAKADCREDDMDDNDARSTKSKKEIDDEEEEEDDDEDGDEEGDNDKGSRKKRSLTLSRRHMEELVEIDAQARGMGIDLNLAGAVARGEKPASMRKRLCAELAKRSESRGPRGGSNGSVEIIRDEREGVAESMEIALISHVLASRGNDGIEYKPKDRREAARVERYRKQADQYMHMGLIDVAAACIGFRGRGSYLTHRDVDDIMTRAFHSTSDFPAIFQNVLNKSLLARYELAMPTYRRIAAQRNFNDFRPHPQIRAGEFPSLQPVSETGEIQYGTSTDLNETVSVKPYGVVFTISRQMLVNDDLAAIDQILGSAGDTVPVFENTTFFQTFLSAAGAGPTLNQDSTAVFASGHGNYVASGSGAAPSVTTIGAGRAALRAMKSPTGLFLNVPPRIILTGPSQETAADQMVTSITPTLTTSVNPFSGRLESISDANITGGQWYLVADPIRLPCFVYGFLNGSTGPRTRTFEPFGVQGVKISLEHDFGVGAIDYRGVYQNYGS